MLICQINFPNCTLRTYLVQLALRMSKICKTAYFAFKFPSAVVYVNCHLSPATIQATGNRIIINAVITNVHLCKGTHFRKFLHDVPIYSENCPHFLIIKLLLLQPVNFKTVSCSTYSRQIMNFYCYRLSTFIVINCR